MMLSKILQWRSLKTRVTVLSLAIFLISIWSLTFYSSRMLREDMQRLLSDQQLSTAAFVAQAINEELDKHIKALENIATLLSPAMEKGDTSTVQTLLRQRPIFQSLFSNGVFVTGLDGIAIADVPFLEGRIGTNYADRDFMPGVLTEGKNVISQPVMGKASKAPIFAIAVPIRDSANKVIGSLVGGTDLSKTNFLDKIGENRYGQTGGYILIAPQHKLIVYATDKELIMQPTPAPGVNRLYDRYAQGFEGSGVILSSRGKKVLSSAKQIPLAGWFIVVRISTEEAFAPIYAMQRRILMLTVILTVLAGISTWWMLQRQLAPMLSVVKIIDTQLASNLPLKFLPITYQDEVGELIDGFNRLLESLVQREEQLKKSDEKFRTIANYIHDWEYWRAPDGKLVYVSPSCERITGYTAEEFSQQPELLLHIIHPDDRQNFQQHVGDLAQNNTTNECHTLEFRILTRSGEERIIEHICQQVFDQAGKPIGRRVSNRDITLRKITDKALRESEETFRQILNVMPIGLWILNKDGVIVSGNPTGQQIWRGVEYVGPEQYGKYKGWWLDTGELIADEEWGGFRAIKNGEFSIDEEIKIECFDGSHKIILHSAIPLFDEQHSIIGAIVINQNITERKKVEKSYQTLFREMLDGFALHEIICSEAGEPIDYRFLAVNPAFERITGLQASDVIGRTVLEVLPNTDKHWIEIYGKVAFTGKPEFFNNSANDLKKHLQITAFCPEPGQFACIFSDITDRKKAEEEQQKLREHLQQSQKMEAIGTLAGGIAHDFNNILGAILGYAEMVRENVQNGSRLHGDIEQVINASHRATDLVKQILAFSRRVETQKIPIRPAAIIKETIKLLRSSIPTTIDIQHSIDDETNQIVADPTQIHQILMNLCTNAYHAMEEVGGVLTISLRNKVLTCQDLLGFPDVQPGIFVELSIRDTGVGISPEIQMRIFDPYFTTKEAGKGTGMGLSIVHGIVKNYNGIITCHSEVGNGTLFQIFLPAISVQSVLETTELQEINGGTEHILFVDDEAILAKMSESMLTRLGYQVTVCTNSIDALKIFQNQPEMFDLVITDQTMPGIIGSELALCILQMRPDIPIILCTGYSAQISHEKAMAIGIKGFAMKPLQKQYITRLIREVLGSK